MWKCIEEKFRKLKSSTPLFCGTHLMKDPVYTVVSMFIYRRATRNPMISLQLTGKFNFPNDTRQKFARLFANEVFKLKTVVTPLFPHCCYFHGTETADGFGRSVGRLAKVFD